MWSVKGNWSLFEEPTAICDPANNLTEGKFKIKSRWTVFQIQLLRVRLNEDENALAYLVRRITAALRNPHAQQSHRHGVKEKKRNKNQKAGEMAVSGTLIYWALCARYYLHISHTLFDLILTIFSWCWNDCLHIVNKTQSS